MKRLGWILVSISLLLGLLPLQAHAANLEVEAKSALLMDVATGTILFEQNCHEPLAPASVTKVMTMLLIMEAIDSDKISWGDSVTTSEAAAAKGGSQVFLKVGERYSRTHCPSPVENDSQYRAWRQHPIGHRIAHESVHRHQSALITLVPQAHECLPTTIRGWGQKRVHHIRNRYALFLIVYQIFDTCEVEAQRETHGAVQWVGWRSCEAVCKIQ